MTGGSRDLSSLWMVDDDKAEILQFCSRLKPISSSNDRFSEKNITKHVPFPHLSARNRFSSVRSVMIRCRFFIEPQYFNERSLPANKSQAG